MMPSNLPLAPQQRLAQSRRAIAAQLSQDRQPAGTAWTELGEPAQDEAGGDHRATSSGWRLLRHAARAWWRHHPVRAVARMARPALDSYAHDKPAALVLIAAGAGAAAVVLRPWRLVTLTGLLAATFRSSDISRLAVSLLSSERRPSPLNKEAP